MTPRYQDLLPPQWQARLQEERRQALLAAANFAAVCAAGDADALYNASLWLNECGPDAWRLAMIKVARLKRVIGKVQQAFVPIWVESKMLPLHVGNRRVLAEARVLLPGGYKGSPLTLYRGARAHERTRRIYGFSWTIDIAIARGFAEHWAQPELSGGGILLKTLASPSAILLIRQPGDDYDEDEVVIDPYRLERVKLIENVAQRS